MRSILSYLLTYLKQLNTNLAFATLTLTALFIFINYYFGLNSYLGTLNHTAQLFGWFVVFVFAFGGVYFLTAVLLPGSFKPSSRFLLLVFIAPILFAWKMSAGFDFHFSDDENVNAYWKVISYWPLKFIVIAFVLFLIWKFINKGEDRLGTRWQKLNIKPYLLMLLIMIPLVGAASLRPEFLAVYPKLQNISYLTQSENSFLYKLLFELSYGIDFISIEVFFRGFLVIAFIKFAGKHAILPMAVFYCTIHFGKPLAECISSFFGGVLLGVITYHTRSIYGGLIVHLGIAWMMELFGFFGNHFLLN